MSLDLRGAAGALRPAVAARPEPKISKLTRVFGAGQSLTYRSVYAGKDGRGRDVWFCWSLHKNVAGYFLGWRHTHSKVSRTSERDRWIARRAKWRAQEVAERRAAAFRRKRGSLDTCPMCRAVAWDGRTCSECDATFERKKRAAPAGGAERLKRARAKRARASRPAPRRRFISEAEV